MNHDIVTMMSAQRRCCKRFAVVSLLLSHSVAFHGFQKQLRVSQAAKFYLAPAAGPSGEAEESPQNPAPRQQEDNNDFTPVISHRQKPQKRRRSEKRRPKNYWLDVSHLEDEFRSFWSDNGIEISADQPPPIPNEKILGYYHRHDLRGAIVSNGGREILSEKLGGASIMPGRWTDAVKQSLELQQLIDAHNSLSADRPPNKPGSSSSQRWSHQSGRKPKGYWSMKAVIQELYEYVDEYREVHGRPSVWMPRSSELTLNGRDDLKQAMNRFGGAVQICRRAGMVPHKEWFYFEGQFELIQGLLRYCDEYEASDYSRLPCVTEIRQNGYKRLHSLIQFYGGRKFLALRFGLLNVPSVADAQFLEMNWGPFDLMFASRLLSFVRDDQLRKKPPLKRCVIAMPSESKLLADSEHGSWLHTKICEFGGYENVARRLGLALV